MDRTPTHFALFELMRIVIPGSYSIFLAFVLFTAFGVPLHPFDSWQFGIPFFLLASVVAGLSYYAKGTPKKRKAFQQNQPSLYILERSRQISAARPLSEDEAKRLYFYILNQLMPPTVHEKIFFFGMVYQVMINIRRTSFWFALTGTAALILQIALTGRTDLPSVTAVAIIALVYVLNVRHNKADRKMQENYQDQIFWLEMHRHTVDALIMLRSQTL